jgi:hypothetical protein
LTDFLLWFYSKKSFIYAGQRLVLSQNKHGNRGMGQHLLRFAAKQQALDVFSTSTSVLPLTRPTA